MAASTPRGARTGMNHSGFCSYEHGAKDTPVCDETTIQENKMTYQRNETPEPMATGFIIGGRYNWKYQSERLIYLGYNWSGNGKWHQFAKVESPDVVWCEVLSSDLGSFEETQAHHV